MTTNNISITDKIDAVEECLKDIRGIQAATYDKWNLARHQTGTSAEILNSLKEELDELSMDEDILMDIKSDLYNELMEMKTEYLLFAMMKKKEAANVK